MILFISYAELRLHPWKAEEMTNTSRFKYSVTVVVQVISGEFGSEAESLYRQQITVKIGSLIDEANLCVYDGDEFGNGKCTVFYLSNSPNDLVELFLETTTTILPFITMLSVKCAK